MRRVLLVEPAYKAKYPPLGLMKISTYHKMLGDDVTFVKGLVNSAKDQVWDRVYISTLFTFHWKQVVETVIFYKRSVHNTKDIFVGGVAATLLPERLRDDTGVEPIRGLLDRPGLLDSDNEIIVDELVPDYSILEEIDYKYPTGNAYFVYATRGCIRHCSFCAVPTLEPKYNGYTSFKAQVEEIERLFGPKKNLMLLDNNVLASERFPEIIQDIKDLGFEAGALFVAPNVLDFYLNRFDDGFYKQGTVLRQTVKIIREFRRQVARYPKVLKKVNDILDKHLVDLDRATADAVKAAALELRPLYARYRGRSQSARSVDFNQGIDARLLDDENMRLLSQTCINPLRIAFDHVELRDLYESRIRMAASHGVTKLSNYVLYNFHDAPEDLYDRLRINVELNEELGTSIFSFPMKYVPVDNTDRHHIGERWCPKYLRAIQVILNVTKGIVAPGKAFFEKAFGSNLEEFRRILLMPEEYILNRCARERDGVISEWWHALEQLDNTKAAVARRLIQSQDKVGMLAEIDDMEYSALFRHYLGGDVAMVRRKL